MVILIASNNTEFRKRSAETLRSGGHQVREACGGAEALWLMEECDYLVLLLDRWLPDLDVGELSIIIKAQHPEVEVRMVGSDSIGTCPIGMDQNAGFCSSCRSCGSWRLAGQVLASSRAGGEDNHSRPIEPLPGMIGSSPAMHQVYRLARLVTPRSTPVLVTGETGTGKELVAKAIHQLGPRARQPMVTMNCAAIPESLLEAELFGHARGAFTGAMQSRLGRIQAAHGGTLFLDEVGDVPLSIQAKLLRFLQEGEVQRLGSPDVIRVDVRVIAATNADLAKRVAERCFREDIYHRLMVFPIPLVPLRSHPEDILPLAEFFLRELAQEAGLPPKTLSPEAEEVLKQYHWPGNVRELRHKVERAFILSESCPEILAEHVSL